MKTIKPYFLIFINVLLLSCANNDNELENSPNIAKNGEMIATVDGETINFKFTYGKIVNGTLGPILDVKGVVESKNDKNIPDFNVYLNLLVLNPSVGNFVVDNNNARKGGALYGNVHKLIVVSTAYKGSGEIEITKLDMDKKLVSGKFYFTAYSSNKTQSAVIKNGSFTNVELTL